MVNILDIGLGFDLAYCKHGIVIGLLDYLYIYIYIEFSGDYFFAATKRANRVTHLPETA